MGKMSVEDCSETAEQELGLKWEERVWSRLRGFQKASGIVRVAEKKEDGFTQLPKVLCCHEAGQESDRLLERKQHPVGKVSWQACLFMLPRMAQHASVSGQGESRGHRFGHHREMGMPVGCSGQQSQLLAHYDLL
ncbi:hypothetical protein ROHU_025415 [Labeo rohita]|uniref:Uncharacterized protein n=1 Tax=Labeo rohita TaxID=84645 RepID=A0A498MMG8_LABRO|nr:hypothetical protein ROHU_025415 [Labeo rohita]